MFKILLGLTAAASAADSGIHKKKYLQKKKDIMKMMKSLEDFGLLLKGVSKTIQIKVKEKRGGFLNML